MIKRPIVLLFAAFLIGNLSYYAQNVYFVWGLFGMFCIFDVLSIVGHIYSKFLTSQDKILLLLPVLFLLGFVGMESRNQTYPVEEVFEEKEECFITGTVKSIDTSGNYLRLSLKKVYIELGEQTYECGMVLVSCDVEDEFHIGNRIQCFGKLMKFEEPGNPGQFDEVSFYKMKGYDYKFKAERVLLLEDKVSWFWDATSRLKLRMLESYEAILNEEDYGLIVAMLLGETAYMDAGLKVLYQKNGISHLLAISGLHITLLGMGFYYSLRKLRIGTIAATLSSIGFILYYGILTGFAVSTNRAVVMMILSLCATIVGKTYDVKCAMTLSAFLILLQNPLQLFSAGFLLSYGAIVGLVIVNGVLTKALRVKHKLFQAVLLSVSVQLVTLPLILTLFFEFPLYSVVINILVLPVSSILVALSLIAGIIGCFSETIGGFFIGGVHYILQFIETLCRFFTKLPGCTQTWGKPSWMDIVLYFFGLTLILCCIYYLTKVRTAIFEVDEGEEIDSKELLQREEKLPEKEKFQEKVKTSEKEKLPEKVKLLENENLQETKEERKEDADPEKGQLQMSRRTRNKEAPSEKVESKNPGNFEGELQNGVLVIDRTRKLPEVWERVEESEIYLPKNQTLRLLILRSCIEKSTYVILSLAILGLMFIFLPEKTKGLEVTLLDVGQGDGIYIETESGNNYMIDGGSSQVNQLAKYRIVPFLKSKGRTSLDTVIVTHSDADHTSGIIELIAEGYPIHRLILPKVLVEDDAYKELVRLAKEAAIPVEYIERGDMIVDGAVKFTCLHPESNFRPSTANSYSTVLSLSYGEFDLLLTGDLEGEGEEAVYELLKEKAEIVDYDVLKVAHHGSKNSTSLALLELIQPEYSLISVGKNNWYGHPNPLLLERLEEVHSNIMTTQDWGAICLRTDGQQLWIQGYQKGEFLLGGN